MIKTDELVPLMILEWVKGDKLGEQEIIKNVEIKGEFTWVNFEGGGRINGHVINEMMILVGVAQEEDLEKHLEKKKNNSLNVSNQTSVKPNKKEIPNKKDNFKQESKNTFGFDILDKAQRDSKMELNFIVDFDFISEEKIKMLLELYGDELFESLKQYIREQLSEELINSCIEEYLNHKFKI